jgi:hypothetical protein
MGKKKSGGHLKGFVDSLIGVQGGTQVPGGVLEVDAFPLNQDGGAKKRANKKPKVQPAPKAKPVPKGKANKRVNKVVTRGGMDVSSLLTALLAIGLRVASDNPLTHKKTSKKSGGCGVRCRKRCKGGSAVESVQNFINNLQTGGNSENVKYEAGMPFTFTGNANNAAQYDPNNLQDTGSFNHLYDLDASYKNILAGNAVTQAAGNQTANYLAAGTTTAITPATTASSTAATSTAATTTTGGGRSKSKPKSISRKPSSKSTRGRKMRREGGQIGDEDKGQPEESVLSSDNNQGVVYPGPSPATLSSDNNQGVVYAGPSPAILSPGNSGVVYPGQSPATLNNREDLINQGFGEEFEGGKRKPRSSRQSPRKATQRNQQSPPSLPSPLSQQKKQHHHLKKGPPRDQVATTVQERHLTS